MELPAAKLAFQFLVLTAARWRGALAPMSRDRSGRGGVDGPGQTDEGERPAPGAAVRSRRTVSGPAAGTGRLKRQIIPGR